MSRADSEFITGTPAALPDAERQRIEAEIQAHLDEAEALIQRLDDVDGDPDFCASEHDGREPDVDDEPSLGWTLSGQLGGFDDREEQTEDEGADEGAECFSNLCRYVPPTKGDIKAAKVVRGFLRRVKRNGKLGRAVSVAAICVPAREVSR